MKSSFRRGAAGLVAGAAIVGLLAGCGDREVKKSDVESQLKTKISEQAKAGNLKLKIGDAKCDDDLKAKVKAQTKCTIEINNSKREYLAVVKKVDGSTVHYQISQPK